MQFLLWTSSCAAPDARIEPPPPAVEATCAQGAQPLTLRCNALLEEPEPTTWTFRGEGTDRTLHRDEALQIELDAWGFPADTALVWEISTPRGGHATGQLHTESLPDDLQLQTQGTPQGLETFAVPYRCAGEAGVVLLGTDGRVRWRQAFPVVGGLGPSAGLVAFDWAGDELVVVRDGKYVLRQDVLGNVQFEAELEGPIHHDAALHGERTVALFAYEEDGRVLDGMYVLDEEGELLATWHLSDVLPIEGTGGGGPFWWDRWPFATDWSHANSLSPDGAAHLLLSLRWQDAVLRVVADPTRSDFGEVEWILTGQEETNLAGDYVWSDGGGFDGQHHASRLSNGGIAVFDNGPPEKESRVLFMQVDEEAKLVHEEATWSMGQHCEVQGGAYELSGGGALATCSPTGQIFEFVPGQTEPVWSAVLTCQGETVSGLGRARPISLP